MLQNNFSLKLHLFEDILSFSSLQIVALQDFLE